MATIAEVEKLAFDLPDSDRAVLAAHLLRSLPSVLHADDEGVAEALRRDAELEAEPAWASRSVSSTSGSETAAADANHSASEGPFRCGRDHGLLRELPSTRTRSGMPYSDVDAIMDYYERVASQELADDFYAELRQFISDAAEQPTSFAVRQRDFRRANLQWFPYHFLFRIVGTTVRILVVRHHRRHPSFGISRRWAGA